MKFFAVWYPVKIDWPSGRLALDLGDAQEAREESPAIDVAAPEAAPAAAPGLLELFTVFAKISLAGFGGVLIWTRRAIVEQHRWMTAEEFNETFALCHFLPGPNVVNLSLVFGSRFRGLAGGLAAFAGLLGPPMLIVTVLAVLYGHFGEIPALRRTLAGVSCAAVGLLLSVMVRMMLPLAGKRDWIGLALLAAVFAAVGVLRLPLPMVLLTAIPLSIGLTYFTRRGVAP